MPEPGSYRVLIPYREPTYELRRGGPPAEPYLAELEVRAATPQEAIELALEGFRRRALQSSVGWVREIEREGIRVERLGP